MMIITLKITGPMQYFGSRLHGEGETGGRKTGLGYGRVRVAQEQLLRKPKAGKNYF